MPPGTGGACFGFLVKAYLGEVNMKDRLFIGIYPAGIVYSDRAREEHGDYARVAFLPYATLTLRVDDSSSPLLGQAKRHAARIAAKRGEAFPIDGSGHTVILGK